MIFSILYKNAKICKSIDQLTKEKLELFEDLNYYDEEVYDNNSMSNFIGSDSVE